MKYIEEELAKKLNITDKEYQQLEKFVELFQEYNQKVNLSGIRETDSIWQKHIIDSLMPLTFEKLSGKVIDIGTGGGVPGVPLAIVNKKIDVNLVDSIGKKVKACEYFIEKLNLKNASSLQARAEILGEDPKHCGKYDVAIARATAYLPTVLSWAENFIKQEGKILLYKTPSHQEISEGRAVAEKLGLKLEKNHNYQLDGKERKLLVYTKKI